METFHGVTVSFHLSVYKFTSNKIRILFGRTISILSDVIGERCALKSPVSTDSTTAAYPAILSQPGQSVKMGHAPISSRKRRHLA